jgi:metallophosphoesterase superfamily enzyme
MKSILILPDLQIPFHDRKFVNVMERFIDQYQPDEVGQIGDFLDEPQPSRWSKGMAGEYAGNLQNDIELGKGIIKRLRIDWIKLGNHDQRIELYVERYAPALSDLGCLRLERLLGLDESGTALHREPFAVAPGWTAAHGHEGSLSSVAGRTAFGLAKRYDGSVVCGHTHRAGIVSETVGISKRRVMTGLEVGHGMDLAKATYVKSPNWQQAFGMLKVDGKLVQPELIPVHNGNFIYEGKRYSA